VKVDVVLFALLKLAPLPVVIVQVPVSPAAGVLAASVAVVPVRESWSGPAEEVVVEQIESIKHRTTKPKVFKLLTIGGKMESENKSL
jgi:hypothetical protein